VSTADQNAELQSRDLTAHAAHQGWDIVEMYQDVMSGTKASRPALNRLMTDACAS
jgi:DNA invertase Pin-like site-specific DNA recombinase